MKDYAQVTDASDSRSTLILRGEARSTNQEVDASLLIVGHGTQAFEYAVSLCGSFSGAHDTSDFERKRDQIVAMQGAINKWCNETCSRITGILEHGNLPDPDSDEDVLVEEITDDDD